jgi:glutathione S-transferase
MSDVTIYGFAPAWGLPTTGPFVMKTLTWLGQNGVDHRFKVQNLSSKSPNGKIPYADVYGKVIADSDRIIQTVAQHKGINIEGRHDPVLIAFEELFHQIVEWELFVHPNGKAALSKYLADLLPPVVRRLAYWQMTSHYAKQLYARGITRHTPDEIAEKGKGLLDTLEAILSERRFLGGDTPNYADMGTFGQVSLGVNWDFSSPVGDYAKTLPNIGNWVSLIREQYIKV